MSDGGLHEDAGSRAEDRLSDLLEVLRAEAPTNGATLPGEVAQKARRQLFVKRFAVAAGALLVAAGETLATVLGVSGRRR